MIGGHTMYVYLTSYTYSVDEFNDFYESSINSRVASIIVY